MKKSIFGGILGSVLTIVLILGGCTPAPQNTNNNPGSNNTQANSSSNTAAPGQTSTPSPGQKGQKAPDFKLKTLDNKEVSLSDFKGKPVVINFWASWCPPCRLEMPDLNQFAADYKDKVAVLGINIAFNDKDADMRKFVADSKLVFPTLLDTDGKATTAYKIGPIPTTIFVDKDGVIQNTLIGAARSKDDFVKRVEPLLK